MPLDANGYARPATARTSARRISTFGGGSVFSRLAIVRAASSDSNTTTEFPSPLSPVSGASHTPLMKPGRLLTVGITTAYVDATETVFFTNNDTDHAHWPTICTNQLGPAPSPNSSQCTVPYSTPPYTYTYGCQIAGHETEAGIIKVFNAVAAVPYDAATSHGGHAR